MDGRDVEKFSLRICRQLYGEIDWPRIQKICSYEPMAEVKEVNIVPLLETVKYKHPNIKIKLIGMARNSKIPKAKFDLIFVPVLAFDENNYRLGWGGGWYDRFLAEQPHAIKIGVGFQNGFIKEGLANQPHDIPLDTIITESR